MKKVMYYLPRILGLLITAFFALFILEGFDPQFGWQSGLAHLAVAVVALGATILAWKKPRIGGWLFIAFGLWYLITALHGEWWSGLITGGVPLATGLLFLWDGYKNKQK